MGSQAAEERERFEHALAEILAAAADRSIALRVLGALAFHMRCPRHGYLQAALGRIYTDLGSAAYGVDAKKIQQLFTDSLGYRADEMVFVESEGARMMFDQPNRSCGSKRRTSSTRYRHQPGPSPDRAGRREGLGLDAHIGWIEARVALHAGQDAAAVHLEGELSANGLEVRG